MRFKSCLRRFLVHHRLEKLLIVHTFYNVILYSMRMTINVAADKALMNKDIEDTYAHIYDMTQNHYLWGNKHSPV